MVRERHGDEERVRVRERTVEGRRGGGEYVIKYLYFRVK